ncbi:MAG: hypothetical protein ACOY4T_01505 [Pseudomonadota bacterium]
MTPDTGPGLLSCLLWSPLLLAAVAWSGIAGWPGRIRWRRMPEGKPSGGLAPEAGKSRREPA